MQNESRIDRWHRHSCLCFHCTDRNVCATLQICRDSAETSPNVARRILASDLRRRVLLFPTLAPCGGLRRASSPNPRPGHDLGPFFGGFRQNTGLRPLPRSPAHWRKLQQLPPRGDLGEVGHLGLARAAKFIGGRRTFRKITQPKRSPITPQRLPNVSATSPTKAEKCLTCPSSCDRPSQLGRSTVFTTITIVGSNGPPRHGDTSALPARANGISTYLPFSHSASGRTTVKGKKGLPRQAIASDDSWIGVRRCRHQPRKNRAHAPHARARFQGFLFLFPTYP
jgi:hypothetical protein